MAEYTTVSESKSILGSMADTEPRCESMSQSMSGHPPEHPPERLLEHQEDYWYEDEFEEKDNYWYEDEFNEKFEYWDDNNFLYSLLPNFMHFQKVEKHGASQNASMLETVRGCGRQVCTAFSSVLF